MTETYDLDGIPAQLVPLILYRIKDYLDTVMVAEVPESNPTRAILVKVGKFQDNPLRKNVSLAISGGDFEEPNYIDGRIDHPDLRDLRILNLPVGEVGGGTYWWRRGTIRYHCYFVRQRFEERKALEYAYDFQGRLMKALETVPMGDLKDDYDEQAYGNVFPESVTFFESGGPKKYIWRGKLYWRCLTWRP